MRKFFAISTAVLAVACGSAWADECVLDGEAPTMPDPATATADDISSTIASIKAYQGALGAYRDCLDVIVNNKKLEKDVRQAALDKFNASVDAETAMVEEWQAFYSAYQEAQG